MKRNLLTLLVTCLAVVSVQADVVYNETFNYTNGNTQVAGAPNWLIHSGAAGNDSFVIGTNLQVGMNRQTDVNRPFTAGFTNSVTNIYASFTINCTNLPTAANYFAHFLLGTTTFHARTWNAPGSLPGTWRLGITTTTTTVGLIQYLPVDLATNTPYQVVINWDETQGANSIASIWVNPISESDHKITASDAVAGAMSTAFAFRQPSTANGANNFLITNLVVATSFDDAATNVWNTNAVAPLMVYSPKGGTNFTGQTVLLSGVAAGQGLGGLAYLWLKDGAIYDDPNSNPDTNRLTFASAVAGDSGAYHLIATTPFGLSVTSAVANLWITNPPVPPTITTHPQNTTVYFGQSATLTVAANGPGTISYQWNHYGTNLPGETGTSLNIPNVQTNNGTTGDYTVGVTNEYGGVLSSNAVVSAVPIPTVSIAFLRTLVDPVNYLPTNSSQVWKATGTVTTFTNLTTGNTSSYYLQDSTAGINIFATFASTFRPALGDVVTFVGVLSSFNSTLELLADTVNNPVASYTVLSNNVCALPSPKAIPFSITNDLALCETNLEGSLVMLANVFFGTNAGNVIATGANTLITVSNGNGETFNVNFSSQDGDTAGQTLPSFATAVIGPFTQNLGNTATPRNQGYQVTVTRFSDIVTSAPSLTIAPAGAQVQLTWSLGRLQCADDVLGPYVDVDPPPCSPYLVTPSAVGPLQFYRTHLSAPDFTYFDTEMLQLDISGGSLPPGVQIRESPTLSSTGKTASQPMPGGTFTLSSYFNVNIEVSLNSGSTWTPPTNGPHRMRLQGPPGNIFPTNTVPPLTWHYTNRPPGFFAFIPPSLVITNIIHYGWTNTYPLPPPGGVTNNHSFFSIVSGQVSVDGGLNFNSFTAPANTTVRVISRP